MHIVIFSILLLVSDTYLLTDMILVVSTTTVQTETQTEIKPLVLVFFDCSD